MFTEDDIKRLVTAFYARVRVDPMLGPVFAQKIPNDQDAWDKHMAHITDFWSSIFLRTKRFTGNPMIKHTTIEGIVPDHFTHWLDLFSDTAGQVLNPGQHAAVTEMAERIAQSLQMGLAFHMDKSGDTEHPFSEFGLRRRHGAD